MSAAIEVGTVAGVDDAEDLAAEAVVVGRRELGQDPTSEVLVRDVERQVQEPFHMMAARTASAHRGVPRGRNAQAVVAVRSVVRSRQATVRRPG